MSDPTKRFTPLYWLSEEEFAELSDYLMDTGFDNDISVEDLNVYED